MPHPFKTAALALAVSASSFAAAPVFAADMLRYDGQAAVRDYRPMHTRVYADVRPLDCSDLIIEYRAPLYPPHTDLVRVCEQPSSASRASYRTR